MSQPQQYIIISGPSNDTRGFKFRGDPSTTHRIGPELRVSPSPKKRTRRIAGNVCAEKAAAQEMKNGTNKKIKYVRKRAELESWSKSINCTIGVPMQRRGGRRTFRTRRRRPRRWVGSARSPTAATGGPLGPPQGRPSHGTAPPRYGSQKQIRWQCCIQI